MKELITYNDINQHRHINSLSSNPTNDQTPSNNLSALTDELFECVWPFCGIDVCTLTVMVLNNYPQIIHIPTKQMRLLTETN